MSPRRWIALSAIAMILSTPTTAFAAGSDPASSGAVEAGAQPSLVNQQLVSATLDPSGLPTSTSLINRIVATDLPVQTVSAQTSTVDLRYLDQSGAPVVSGSNVEYNVGGPGQTSASTQASFNKPLPVALHAEYATAGEGKKGIDPMSVAGKSGDLSIHYTVTNTAVEQQQITFANALGEQTTQQQPVFAPFVGTLIAELAPGIDLLDAGDAVVGTTSQGNTSLQWNLVLYPPMGSYEQQLRFRVNSTSLQIPAVQLEVIPVANTQDPAVGFSADLLSQSVEGNEKLASGISDLDDATVKLADAASKLTAGQRKQASATQAARNGSSKLTKGQAGLTSGLVELSDGLAGLAGASGLPALSAGARKLQQSVGLIAKGVGSAADPPIPTPPPFPPKVTLVQAIRAVQALITVARDGAVSAATDSASADTAIQTVRQNLGCPPVTQPQNTVPNCPELLVALTKTTSALTKAGLVATGLTALNNQLLGPILTKIFDLSTALESGNPASPGVYEALGQLNDGLQTATVAASELATGANSAESGSRDLTAGSADLTKGLGALAGGSQELASGSSQLAAGAESLHTDGTSALLNSVVDSSDKPSLANAYLAAASGRADDATPYPPPDGAVGHVAYVFTLSPPEPAPHANPYLLAIAAIFAVAIAVVVVRRIRTPVSP